MKPFKESNKLLNDSSKLRKQLRDDGYLFFRGIIPKNEILQLSILDPTLAILDETDSGLDVDALRTVADGVNAMSSDERSFILPPSYKTKSLLLTILKGKSVS